MKKKIFSFICITIIFLTLILNSVYAQINFAFNEILKANWGSSDTEVGFNQSFDKNYGPSSFFVTTDKQIYILDAVNKKVKKFDSIQNKLVSLPFTLPSDMFIDIVVDLQNHLYLLDIENNIYEYTLSGTLLNRIAVSNKIQIIKGLKIINNKLFVWTSTDWLYLVKDGDNILNQDMQLTNFYQGIFTNAGKYFKTICENKNTGKIQELNSAGIILNENSISFSENNLLTFIFIDALQSDYFYILTEKENLDSKLTISRKLKIYAGSGVELYNINLPQIYYSYIDKEFQIDTDGNIYHLISDTDGITLVQLLKSVAKFPSGVAPAPSGITPANFDYPQKYNRYYNFNQNLKQIPTEFEMPPESNLPENLRRTITRPTTSDASVTRSEALVIAEAYRDLQWSAIASNISSGTVTCGDGHIIRTPSWVTVGSKTAVPYKWGGFSSIETFLSKASAGVYTGSDYTSDVSPSDNYCVGVDCSGFVSRCWRKSSKYGTSTLPDISYALSGYDDLKTGDIINLAGSHVRLFSKKEENGTYSFIEAMGTYWRVMSRNYTASAISSYTPRRYNNILDIEAPVLLGIFNSTDTNIIVKWKSPADPAVDNIKIYLSGDGDSFYLKSTVNAFTETTVLTGLKSGNTYYCNSTFDSGGREGLYSHTYIFRVTPNNKADILIVEDEKRYGAQNSAQYFGEPLSNKNYYYDICTSDAVVGNTVSLSDYWTVIWFTGRASYTSDDYALSAAERAKLRTYLQNGGNLFITGQEIAYSLDYKGLDDSVPFLTNYLKADYVADDAGADVSLTGITGKLLEGVTFDLDEDNGLLNDGGAYDARFPDVINAVSGGDTICQYSAGNYGGTSYKGLFPGGTISGAMVYFSFSFECIKSATSRNTVMQKVIGYFGTPTVDTVPAITTVTNYMKNPGESFTIQLTAVDNKDTAAGLIWSLSDTDASIWQTISIIEGETDYLVLKAKSVIGTDTFILKVTDSDGMIDTVQMVIILAATAVPDTPIIYYIKNTSGGTSALVKWKNDDKAYKYVIYKSPDNSVYTAIDTVYTPNVSTTITGLSSNTKYYFKIRSYNSMDTASPDYSMTLGIRTKSDTVDYILIEDDLCTGPHSYIAKFVGALTNAQRSFDCAMSDAVVDGAINLSDYKVVIWSCGNDNKNINTSLNIEEREKIKAYLDNGGKLFISGNNILYDLNSLDPDFSERYLKSNFGYDDSYRYTLQPFSSGVLNGVDTIYIWTDDGGSLQGSAAYQATLPDRSNISSSTALYGGRSTLKYYNSGWVAAVDFTGGFDIAFDSSYQEVSNNISKLLFFHFAFECINDIDTRASVMSKIVSYFDSSSVAGRITLEALTDNSGATVSLIKSDFSDTKICITDSIGRFRFDFLTPGNYFLKSEKDVYLTQKSANFTLAIGIDTFICMTLKVGDVKKDNKINIYDASRVKSNDPKSDFNNDSIINNTDMSYIRKNFGIIGD